jgi:hypothetical protein
MTFTAENLSIKDGRLHVCDALQEMVEDITGSFPDIDDPVEMVRYLQAEREKLQGGDKSTAPGQLNAVFHDELAALQTGIETLIGGRTTTYLN